VSCCNIHNLNNKTTDIRLVDVAQRLGQPREISVFIICVFIDCLI
jgi:hypothetical protein